MDKAYNHQEHEKRIYQLWEKSGGFSPTTNPKAEPYCIIMPPPNANDPLHVGHACFVTVEDVLIRVARMQGKAALWLPGTDHAGIETQFVFEKKLGKEGKSRFDFDRETLFKMIWEYVEENSGVAIDQMKKLGGSADWRRYKFTLDSDVVEKVVETFMELHKDGLVYRDLRLVNYCCKCGTAFSELEVNHEDRNDPLVYVKYNVVEGGQPVVVATVRPETIFADTAIAIHPKHKRQAELVGKKVTNPLSKVNIPVIEDDGVDPEFGTGMLKITPFHDANDWEIWQKHKSEMSDPIQVVGFEGKMINVGARYVGLNVATAREESIKELSELGMIEKVDNTYHHSVGVCYRCSRVIEPLPRPQFFIKVKSLSDRAIKAIDNSEVRVFGAGHDKILRHWLTNLKDWNVSRQIVWGIRMPVWYEIPRLKNNNLHISNTKHKTNDQNLNIEIVFIDKQKNKVVGIVGKLLEKYSLEEINSGLQSMRAPVNASFVVSPTPPGENYIQETDTFDTWFSSSQWPFVTLMTNKPEDFKKFYPTQVMETAYDILMFWVMRMLMMGLYKTGKAPFRTVYLHGLIRDEKGQKMSKSKGNVVNPLDVVEKYGADALRMALVIRSSAGLDKNVGEQDFRSMRNLTNKIWNSTRYVLMNMAGNQTATSAPIAIPMSEIVDQRKKYRKHLKQVVNEVTKQIQNFRVGMAAETVYNEYWHWFCDVCIEANKQGELESVELLHGLLVFLKLLHPFVPFVTEVAYQEIRQSPDLKKGFKSLFESSELMCANWPTS